MIIVLKSVGDVLVTTPLARAFKKNLSGSRVYFLTGHASEKILRHNPYLDGVIVAGPGAISKLKRIKFEISVDFMNSAVSGYYSLFSGAKKRIAFYRPWGFWCYNSMIPRSDCGYSAKDRLQVLNALNIDADGIGLDLCFSYKEQKAAENFFIKNNIARDDLTITLDITNKRKYRQWDGEKFCRFADLCAEKLKAKVIFLWGPGEYDYVNGCMTKCSHRHFLCDNFDLLELAALIKNCKAHVGTSSAPGHIAVSQNIPSFTIYCQRTNPWNWTPPDITQHRYIQGDFNRLSADEVFSKFRVFLADIERCHL